MAGLPRDEGTALQADCEQAGRKGNRVPLRQRLRARPRNQAAGALRLPFTGFVREVAVVGAVELVVHADVPVGSAVVRTVVLAAVVPDVARCRGRGGCMPGPLLDPGGVDPAEADEGRRRH